MTSVVDALLSEEIGRAQGGDDNLCLWLVGGGFDARWFRMMRTLSGVVAEHVEVETADLLQAKSRMLGASQYDELWGSIRTQPGEPEEWTVSARDGLLPVVVLQGCWKRMNEEQFFKLLARVAAGVPGARVILDLPGEDMKAAGPWIPNSTFRELGFVVETDIRVRRRPNLLTRQREKICGGMEGYRVVRLEVGQR